MAKRRKAGKPKSTKAQFKEAQVLLPLTFNDGSTVPEDTIQHMLNEVYVAFDGWTFEGPIKGAYRMRSGEQRVESHLKVIVVLRPAQLSQLEEMVARWAGSLGQEAMLLKVSDSAVQFIPPAGPEEET